MTTDMISRHPAIFYFWRSTCRGVDITFTFYIQHIRVVGGSSGCASRCSMFRNKIHTFNYVLLIYRSNVCPAGKRKYSSYYIFSVCPRRYTTVVVVDTTAVHRRTGVCF